MEHQRTVVIHEQDGTKVSVIERMQIDSADSPFGYYISGRLEAASLVIETADGAVRVVDLDQLPARFRC